MARPALDRRIADEWTLATELIAWERPRNLQAIPIQWSLTWKRAKRLFCKWQGQDHDLGTGQNYLVKPLSAIKKDLRHGSRYWRAPD